jgi:NAD(P)-dependent dehydrogenase (short-subunit alcohol dehydrogenase family)
MELDLTGKTAIITGSGRGIGEEIAHTFAEAGANVVTAARSVDEIEATSAALEEEYGVESIAVPTDLSELDDIEALVEATVEEFGRSEVLINNAALNLTNPPDEQTVEEVDAMLSVNLRSVFFLTRRWATQFRASDAERGRVINIASNSALFGIPAMTLYGATNAGVQALTRGYAATLAEDGVTVNSVTPGLINVGRIQDLLARQDRGEIERIHNLEEHPLERPGEPEEVAYACLFLAYDLADYISGTDILVDGGLDITRKMYTV